jgi:hypothetical protein
MPVARPVDRTPTAERRRPAAVPAVQRSAVPATSTAQSLQVRLGNQGTQAMIARLMATPTRDGNSVAPVAVTSQPASAIQLSAAGRPSIEISKPTDPAEKEAEETAKKVMRMGEPPATPFDAQQKAGTSAQRVHRSASTDAAGQLSAPVAANIHGLNGGGSPLPAATRAFFEPRFGTDFSNVRVHTGGDAAGTASSISAKAFTVGRDIAFAAGQYAPHSDEGQHLLAHELTHVVQQAGAADDTSDQKVMRAGFPGFGLPAGSPGPKYPTAPKAPPSEAAVRAGAEEVVELKGHTTFDPSPALAEMIDYLSPQVALSVRVRFGTLASGRIDIKRRGGSFMSTEDPAMIDLKHPAFPGGGYLAPPRLLISIVNSVIGGRVQFFPWDRLPGSLAGGWLQAFPLQKLLGWKGVDRIRPALSVNDISGGVLRYRLENFTYRLDGEWEGLGNFDVTDHNVQFAADTDIKVPGVANSKMPLEWTAGNVFGSAKLSLTLAPKDILGGKFSGSLEGSFVNGVTNITGEATYTSEKVNGTVTIRVAPVQEAWAQLATHQLPGPGQITALTGPNTSHAVFGWGVLDFHFNEWLSGRASVIVDPAGFITTYGYIRPTKEWSFLEGDELAGAVTLAEGSVSGFVPTGVLFSGITGKLAAKLSLAGRVGPITIHDLELAGVYSTNPGVPLSLSLSGVIDVSAIGKIILDLTGTLSYTAVGEHGEIVAVEANVKGEGIIKAYALVKPTFSVEKPKGSDTQFRIKGTFKAGAGLYLGLSGTLGARIFKIGLPKFRSKKYQWFVGGVGLKSELDYVLGDPKGPTLGHEDYKFDETEFRQKAQQLLADKLEWDDQNKKETTVREDQTTRAPEVPLPPPKVILFNMNRAQHKLWIESGPEPTLIMETKREPLKNKLRVEATQLKQEENTATGSQKALIKAEEAAIAALNKQATDVETSAAALEKRQGDVAGLQELARQIAMYSAQFTKTDIGDRTADMDSDEAKLLPGEGLVGTYGELSKVGSKGDNVTPHHMPQDKYMAEKLKGNPGGETWVYSEGVCINMYHPVPKPKQGRHFFTRTYGAFGNPPRFHEKPMEALQKDIANVRAVYQKDNLLDGRIENALARLHALNVKNYPKLFRGGP